MPSEFWLTKADKAYVAAWKAEQDGKTLFSFVGERLDAFLVFLRGTFGRLALALLAAVLLARRLVLPFTLKAARDPARPCACADGLKRLREEHRAGRVPA